MRPSIGRIVHYIGDGTLLSSSDNHYPAIVTHVWSDTCVNLFVFPKGSPVDERNSGVKTSVVWDELRQTLFSCHGPPAL